VQNGQTLATPFVTLSVDTFSERGLIGVAVDPNFATNHFVYVYYTTTTPVNRISRFTADASGNVAVPGSERILLDNIPSTNGNHNGGGLIFGKDGKLYAGVGESGVMANSQTLANLAGKILRLDPNGPNIIPTDNPFFNTAMGDNRAIWALGLRNPFTLAVQPGTGVIHINDVGGGLFEEVNVGVAGANYGWPTTEGTFNQAMFPQFMEPLYAYAHGTGPLQGNSIAGGAFYNPTNQLFGSAFVGDYFFGDFVNSRIYLRDSTSGAVTTFSNSTAGGGVVDLDVLPDGRLLYLSLNTGRIYQITPGSGTPSPPVPPVPPVLTRLIAVGTGGNTPSQVVALNADGSTRLTVNAYAGYTGGVRVATGDVTGDGIEDIITGTSQGGPPHIKVFEGVTGGLVYSFYAFDPGFLGGVFVASGDVNGDGRADMIVSTATGSSHVKVFDGLTGAEIRSFLTFPGFAGGVTVAAGNLDGDSFADIIVGTATGASHVKAFSGASNALIRSFLAFDAFPGGVTVGFAGGAIIVGTATATTHVKAFNSAGATVQSFFAFAGFPGGVRVGGNGSTILVGAGPGAGPHIRGIDLLTGAEIFSRFAFDPPTPGGIFVG
jgi:glucose/arabinose dehydrogenase